MEKVKKQCIRVIGEEGQTRVVNVVNANDAKSIMAKVLHKFGMDDPNLVSKYSIFVGSSGEGAGENVTS